METHYWDSTLGLIPSGDGGAAGLRKHRHARTTPRDARAEAPQGPPTRGKHRLRSPRRHTSTDTSATSATARTGIIVTPRHVAPSRVARWRSDRGVLLPVAARLAMESCYSGQPLDEYRRRAGTRTVNLTLVTLKDQCSPCAETVCSRAIDPSRAASSSCAASPSCPSPR